MRDRRARRPAAPQPRDHCTRPGNSAAPRLTPRLNAFRGAGELP
jgi:hypothetical protein